MTICSRPFLSSSAATRPRTRMLPRPVSAYCLMPAIPQIVQPVGKSGALDMMHQALDRDVRIVDLRADGVDHLAEVVRRNVRCHPDGDASATIDEQVGKGGGKDRRFGPGLVVVGDEIHGVLLHVVHERCTQVREPRFRVTHGRRRIAFDGSEVALAID